MNQPLNVMNDTEGSPQDGSSTPGKQTVPISNVEDVLEYLFKLKLRDTSWQRECFFGCVQFIACLYCLPVVSYQFNRNGYDTNETVVATAILCGIGCILSGILTNLPFIVAPPTSVTIFFSVFMLEHSVDQATSNRVLLITGSVLILCLYRPLLALISNLIPKSIQVGATVGTGMITALAGLVEINFVVTGTYQFFEYDD